LRVAFDASTAAFRQKTGTGVYCDELIRAYQSRFSNDQVIHTYRLSRRVRGKSFLLPVPANASREILIDPWTYFKGGNYDIFHGLNSRLPLLTRSKMVATVHDLFSIFGEFSDAQFREDQAHKLKQMIARADHVIVPATFTRDELVNRIGVHSSKVTVVPEGVRQLFLNNSKKQDSFARVQEHFKIKNPYLLFVGTLEKRKNVVGLIKTFVDLNRHYPEKMDLVLVGHPGFQYEEIKKEIEKSEIDSQIKILGFVGEVSLAELYQACEAFVFLSLEEGFGIPVIEAMACGVPVMTSNTTSLPEVGKGYSWLVDPHNHEEAAMTLAKILKKEPSTVERIKAGQAFARTQTWSMVAEKTREVYVRVLGTKSPSFQSS